MYKILYPLWLAIASSHIKPSSQIKVTLGMTGLKTRSTRYIQILNGIEKNVF